jgi:hypothetical protein
MLHVIRPGGIDAIDQALAFALCNYTFGYDNYLKDRYHISCATEGFFLLRIWSAVRCTDPRVMSRLTFLQEIDA